MQQLPPIVVFLVVLCNGVLSSNLEHDGWVHINIEHSLSSEHEPQFTERGNVTIQSLRIGKADVEQKPMVPEDKSRLLDLAAGNKLYFVRATVNGNDGSQRVFVSTLKACMLIESGLDDRLLISLDYAGRVVAVTSFIASKSTCEGAVVPEENLNSFTTTVYVKYSEAGPIPDTASYIQKLEREREAKEHGEVKDNRSFLAKYWMYIVPVVVIMMLSSMANPDGAGGQAR